MAEEADKFWDARRTASYTAANHSQPLFSLPACSPSSNYFYSPSPFHSNQLTIDALYAIITGNTEPQHSDVIHRGNSARKTPMLPAANSMKLLNSRRKTNSPTWQFLVDTGVTRTIFPLKSSTPSTGPILLTVNGKITLAWELRICQFS